MAQGPNGFVTHHRQIDAVSEPLATQVTEDNSTVVNSTYVVTRHSLGTHFQMNTTNNYYVTLEISGLSSWRHIHGFVRFSNYQTGGGETYQFYQYTHNGSSSGYSCADIANSTHSSSVRTINPGFFLGSLPMRSSVASTVSKMQWNFQSGRHHPMVWVDFTVATHGSYGYNPDIGDVKLHATNSTI